MIHLVTKAGDLQGGKDNWGIAGRFEYDFSVTEANWHEIVVTGVANGVRFVVVDDRQRERLRVWNHSGALDARRRKVSNIWLEPGKHTLTLSRLFWTGFPSVEAVQILPSGSSPERRVMASIDSPRMFRRGECPPLKITAGGGGSSAVVTYRVNPDGTGILRDKGEVQFPASATPTVREVVVPCDEGGRFAIRFGQPARQFDDFHVRPVVYEVIDPRPAKVSAPARPSGILLEIDAAVQAPDFWDGGEPGVVNAAFGRYRESGGNGWTQWQRVPEAVRRSMPVPSWFAYTLRGLKAQQGYVIEIEYPDDARRTFAIAVRDAAPEGIPAIGVDSGGSFRVSNGMQRSEIVIWPRADEPRIVFMNAHPGRGAAVSRITVKALQEPVPPPAKASSRRTFANWYEEGSNFVRSVGVPGFDVVGMRVATDRWLDGVARLGANLVMPTAVIYSFALYPSRFHVAFSEDPDDDLLRRVMLGAEARDLRVAPEFHVRADELGWLFPGPPEAKPNLLVSKDGVTNWFQGDGKTRNLPPLYSPTHRGNVDWYVDMVGELADRYRDSPSFAGVSLRFMQWANPGILNFHSLDWGYDDETFRAFVADTRLKLPAEVHSEAVSLYSRARIRHRLLTGAFRDQWLAWRSERVTQNIARIRDRIRKARPDAQLYLHLFAGGGTAAQTWWSDAGIDVRRLQELEGVVLVNASYRIGRREADPAVTAAERTHLVGDGALFSAQGADRRGRFTNSANYLEATELVVPPASLGFAPGTRAIWASAIAIPAGRNQLEPFALQLAETDAAQLGLGGNGYAFGQPLLREFAREFTSLPNVPFQQRRDARDPVAVWTATQNDSFLFYAVNREPYPIRVSIKFAGEGSIRRLSTGGLAGTVQKGLEFDVDAYGLLAFSAPKGASIRTVAVRVPEEELRAIAASINWLGTDLGAGISTRLRNDVVLPAARQAHAALAQGAIWAARREFESPALVDIYQSSNRWPPHIGRAR